MYFHHFKFLTHSVFLILQENQSYAKHLVVDRNYIYSRDIAFVSLYGADFLFFCFCFFGVLMTQECLSFQIKDGKDCLKMRGLGPLRMTR